MINKTSKFCVLMLCVFLAFGCSKNRFKKNSDLDVFTFGLAGYDDYRFCNKIDPRFIDPYPNGRNPSKTCIRYQYYTCHINHYCNGDKECEKDATWWLPIWQGTENDLVKRVEFTKEKCDKEQQRNSAQKK